MQSKEELMEKGIQCQTILTREQIDWLRKRGTPIMETLYHSSKEQDRKEKEWIYEVDKSQREIRPC